MKVLDYINNRNYKLTLEKLIIGVEEPIFIKGVGEILAKADSGNSAFNVLHGEDFYNQGDVVVFTTYDEEDKPHRVSKKIQGTVDINIGAGHTETRPIVLLDVKFAGEEYINVPFTIGNRTNSKNKVLLGKEFLTKELDVLIDVSKDNISDKNIEVDVPVTEGTAAEQGGNNVFITRKKNNPSGATSKIMRGATKTYGAVKGAYNMLKNWGNSEQGIFSKIKTAKNDWKQMMADINNYQKTDKELIFKHLTKAFQARHQRISDIFNNPQVIKILDYLGNDYAGNNNIKQDEMPKHRPNRSRVSEAVEAPAQQMTDSTENQQNNIGIFKKAQAVVNKESKTIVYLVIYDGNNINAAKQILSSNYQNFNGDFSQLISAAELTAENSRTQTVSNNIVNTLLQNGINSAIVACTGIKGDRKVTEVTDIFKFVDGVEEHESTKVDNQPESTKRPTSEERLANPKTENIFGEKLSAIDNKLNGIDYKMAINFIGSYGANVDDIYSYPVFSFIDKASVVAHNAKDTNVNKQVILYYMIFAKNKPSNEEMAISLKKGKEAIGKLLPFFDIDSISEAANAYISEFNAAIGQNGILVACFGDETDRRGLFLGGKTEKNAAINPKMLSFDKKRDDKKESAIRQKDWKTFIASLPASYSDYTQVQYNQLFDRINRLTAGKNNYMVPMPLSFDIQNNNDKNVQSVIPSKNGKMIMKRKGENDSIYEYDIINKNFKKYITLRSVEKQESEKNNVEEPADVVEPEVIEDKQDKADIDIQNSDNITDEKDDKINDFSDSGDKNKLPSEKVKKETATAKQQKNGKKKKDIAEVIVTDKKTTNERSQPKGTSKKRAKKNPYKYNREQQLKPAADVYNAASALSKSVSKETLSSLKDILSS